MSFARPFSTHSLSAAFGMPLLKLVCLRMRGKSATEHSSSTFCLVCVGQTLMMNPMLRSCSTGCVVSAARKGRLPSLSKVLVQAEFGATEYRLVINHSNICTPSVSHFVRVAMCVRRKRELPYLTSTLGSCPSLTHGPHDQPEADSGGTAGCRRWHTHSTMCGGSVWR